MAFKLFKGIFWFWDEKWREKLCLYTVTSATMVHFFSEAVCRMPQKSEAVFPMGYKISWNIMIFATVHVWSNLCSCGTKFQFFSEAVREMPHKFWSCSIPMWYNISWIIIFSRTLQSVHLTSTPSVGLETN